MTKRKNGLKLLFFGMLTGGILGLTVLVSKQILKTELIGLLQDELSAVTDCQLLFDEIDISYLSLRASGKNGRIECNGKAYLSISKLLADFSLRGLHKGEIELVQLQLFDGFAEGVLAQSPTFKFIDRLTEPSSPGSEPLLRLRLLNLSLQNSQFYEQTSIGQLWADGVSLEVSRTPEEHFALRPTVESLRFELPERISSTGKNLPPRTLKIGGATSDIIIFDTLADFSPLMIQLGSASAGLSMKSLFKQDYALAGELGFDIDSGSLDFPEWIQTSMKGQARVLGALDNPGFQGELELKSNLSSQYRIDSQTVLEFTRGRSDFQFDFNHGTPLLYLSKIEAHGPLCSIYSTVPFELKGNTLQSGFSGKAQQIDFAGLNFHDVNFTFSLSGQLDALLTQLDARAAQVSSGSYFARDIKLKLEEFDGTLKYQAQQFDGSHRTLGIQGSLDLSEEPIVLRDVLFDFDEFSLLPDDAGTPLRVSGSGSLSGPLDFSLMSGDADIVLSSNHFEGEAALRGKAHLKDGLLKIGVQNQTQSVSLSLESPLRVGERGQLNVQLKKFKLKEYDPKFDCIESSMSLEYWFNYDSPLQGNGKLNIPALSLGCSPYTLALGNSQEITIRNGTLDIEKLTMVGQGSEFAISGTLSLLDESDLQLDGKMKLNTLAPLLPTLDDLRGTIDASLELKGQIEEPIITGFARIDEGELLLESANISLTSATGMVEVDARRIQLTELQGSLNGGRFFIDGMIYPLEIAQSRLQLQFEGALFEPFPDMSGVLSGNLKLLAAENEKLATLSGEVTLESAELIKKFDLASLLRSVPGLLFSKRKQSLAESSSDSNINLDLLLSIPRNTRITTNFGEVELGGQLTLEGTTSRPVVSGNLAALQGWIGFRDRRFVVTSGQVVFDADQAEPQIEILAESTLRAPEGDSVLVLLEASGPLSQPDVRLTSDRGHSEQEILDILAYSGTLRSVAYYESGLNPETSLLEQSDSFEDWLLGIAAIDSLTIEPGFNFRRGLNEPSLVARKYLTPSLSVIGQSFVTTGDSTAILRYDLFPAVRLLGSAQTAQGVQNSPLGIDLAYTIFSSEQSYLDVTMQGNSSFSKARLLKALRLSNQSRISTAGINEIARALKNFYLEHGYKSASVLAFCPVGEQFCQHLVLTVDEGRLWEVSQLEVTGQFPEKILDLSELEMRTIGKPASKELLESIESEYLSALRSEGYIAARVSARYIAGEKQSSLEQKLSLNIRAGTPVSFNFKGNRAFSAEDFLETINLFKRKQPFGSNTIKILIENIERLYRNAGYLYATLHYSEDRDVDRLIYSITIKEEQQVRVSEVTWQIDDSALAQEFSQILKQKTSEEKQHEILGPEYAVAERLDETLEILQFLLKEQGYPDAQLSYDIIPDQNRSDLVSIRYNIITGARKVADWFSVSGWPADLDLPAQPEPPYSIPIANQYVSRLLNELQAQGYLQANLSSSLLEDGQSLLVRVEPGPQTLIPQILVVGNRNISEDVILKNINFSAGQVWKSARIAESRKKLLQLGLFSRVEILPSDGELDQEVENVLIKVLEKPLQSLEVGGGLNSEFGIHAFGEATDRELFADGKTLALRFDTFYNPDQSSVERGLASLRYTDNNLLNSGLILSEEIRYLRFDLSTFEFNFDRLAFSSTAYRSWTEGLSFDFGHTIFDEQLDDVSDDVILSNLDTGHVRLSFFSNSLTYDGRDNPLLPQKGLYTSLNTALASEQIGSDANYFSGTGQIAYLFPLGRIWYKDLSLAVNSQARFANTFQGTDDIPITQRFYLGGQRSVRGFRENSLGPRGELGGVIGGDFSLLGNFELRYRLFNSVSVHTFYDTGNVFLRDDGFSFGSLRRSAGLGMRFLSPIGPIGFDLGHPLDRQSGEPALRLHFAIGSVF